MAGFNRVKYDKDCPCQPDCGERSPTCHSTCERYLKYRAGKDAELEERGAALKKKNVSTEASKARARRCERIAQEKARGSR